MKCFRGKKLRLVLLTQTDSHSVLVSRKYRSQPSTMDLYIHLFKPGRNYTKTNTESGEDTLEVLTVPVARRGRLSSLFCLIFCLHFLAFLQ